MTPTKSEMIEWLIDFNTWFKEEWFKSFCWIKAIVEESEGE